MIWPTIDLMVFYGGKLFGTFTKKEFKALNLYATELEIYNGCYIYVTPQRSPGFAQGWFRGDFTPVLLEDVPKELLLLKLLLT